MNKTLSAGQIAAVCYADVFDYPLTEKEIKTYEVCCHSGHRAGIPALPAGRYKNYIDPRVSLRSPEDDIQVNKHMFYLKGRQNVVKLRQEREKYSLKKFRTAENTASFLHFIPTVKMVAVTGALAMNNCDEDDDIDLLIIAKTGTIWTTRFLSILLLELLGRRRRPNGEKHSNKVCLNMFIDENHLQVPKEEQDVFSAHEVAQVKILFSRNDTAPNFWKENEWIEKYLPNFKLQITNYDKNPKYKILNTKYLPFVPEKIFKKIQLWYMKNKRTTEVIRDGYLRFHPNDARKWVLAEYRKRLRKAGLG